MMAEPKKPTERTGGWIALHRRILKHWLWTERREFSRAEAWIDILMAARWSDDSAQVLIGGELHTCQRGQCIYSVGTWAARWNWTESKVRRFLKLLKTDGMIDTQTTSKTTVITVCNFDAYQSERRTDDGQTDEQTDRQATTTEQGKQNEQGKTLFGGSPPPAGRSASKPKRQREPDPIWDALIASYYPDGLPDSHHSKVGKVTKDLKQQNADPIDIPIRKARMEAAWDGKACTMTALAGNWQQYAEDRPARGNNNHIPRRQGRVVSTPDKIAQADDDDALIREYSQRMIAKANAEEAKRLAVADTKGQR